MLLKVTVIVHLTSLLLGASSFKLNSLVQIPFLQQDVNQKAITEEDGPLTSMTAASPYFGKQIPQSERATWYVNCSSTLKNHRCNNAKDGKNTTFWQTKVDSGSIDPLPHSITIDLRREKSVNAISMRPLPDADLGGAIAGHKVYLSLNQTTWNLVAFGTWFEDLNDKFAVFEPQLARYIRLEATSATNETQYIRVVDIGVWATPPIKPSSRGLGKWGHTVNFPLVPVGVFIDPIGGKVISFSSYAHDMFGQTTTDHTTLTSTWDPSTHKVSHRQIRDTGHDMFCPGMAFDVDGRMIISGGETADKVSIYEPKTDNWYNASEMITARGYQGSVTLANGQIFVIGGSWGPHGLPTGSRAGEIYDTKADRWTLLQNCPSKPIETTEDWEGGYRSDNHVWLMGWRNNSVFHAGPSKNMHWITTGDSGAVKNATQRGTNDTMCGVAVMYDAAEGKILAAGGASSYNYRDGDGEVRGEKATNKASIITLNQVNESVEVKSAGQGLSFARSFGHAVVLPNGETLVVGGQEEPRVFNEKTPVLTPEIYSPDKDTWTLGAPNSVIRVYHSFALLLRDATVLVGGGGLSNQFDVNHFDAQIYIPHYLLTEIGERAPRPVILETSATSVLPGGNFSITTDIDVVSASLVRYGGATHSLNNDQRRIALNLQTIGSPRKYGVIIPSDGGVALPGYYMLFVTNSQGVPSEATNIQIRVARDHEN